MTREKKSRREKKSANALPEPLEAYVRQLAKEAAGKPLDESLGPDSPMKSLIGRMVELAYEEEMKAHLGHDRYERKLDEEGNLIPHKNTRNGSSKKRLKTSFGETTVEVPRDRNGDFEPQIIPKHGSITQDLESRIVSMCGFRKLWPVFFRKLWPVISPATSHVHRLRVD